MRSRKQSVRGPGNPEQQVQSIDKVTGGCLHTRMTLTDIKVPRGNRRTLKFWPHRLDSLLNPVVAYE